MNKLKFLPDGIIVEEGRPDHPLSLAWLLCHHNALLDRVAELEADLRTRPLDLRRERDEWRAKYNEMRDSKQALNDAKQKEIGRIIHECNALRLRRRNAEAEAEDLRQKLNRVRQALEAGQ